MAINIEYRANKIAEAKIRSAVDFGGLWYARTTYTAMNPKFHKIGWVRMLDVVGSVCIADYLWKKGTAKIEAIEPNTSYWGHEIGYGTQKLLMLKNPVVAYIHIRENLMMLETPKQGRDYGKIDTNTRR